MKRMEIKADGPQTVELPSAGEAWSGCRRATQSAGAVSAAGNPYVIAACLGAALLSSAARPGPAQRR